MKKAWFFLLIIISIFNYSPVFSYQEPTHEKITLHALHYLYEKVAPDNFPVDLFESLTERCRNGRKNATCSSLITGANDEDFIPRFILHFSPELTSPIALANCSSRDWAFKDRTCIAAPFGIFTLPLTNQYNWQAAIDNPGTPKGWYALGFVLHLLEDLTTPAHVRNDIHPPGDGDPFEKRTGYNPESKKRSSNYPQPDKSCIPKKGDDCLYKSTFFPTKDTFDEAREAGAMIDDNYLISFSDPEKFFLQLQQYTQNNFFSKDTVFHPDFPTKIEIDYQKKDKDYFYDTKGRKVAHKGKKYSKTKDKTDSDIDDVVAIEQFDRLGRMAVLYVASLINFYNNATSPTITGQEPLSTPYETPLTIDLNDLTARPSYIDSTSIYPDDFELNTLKPLVEANYTVSGNTITPIDGFFGELTVPVIIMDSGLNESPAFNLKVLVEPPPLPLPPEGLKVKQDRDGLSCSFNESFLADSYKIYWSQTGVTSNVPVVIPSSDGNSYFFSNLNAGKEYCFRVSSINASGESELSNEICNQVCDITEEDCSNPLRPSTPSTYGSANYSASDPWVKPAYKIGDPHLSTLDRFGFDLHMHGEVILTKSSVDAINNLEIQSRPQQWHNRDEFSADTAYAMRVNEDIVGFYLAPDLIIYLNHEPVTLIEEGYYDLPSGGQIYKYGNNYTVIWPDNSQARIRIKTDFMEVKLYLDIRHQNKVMGVFGNYDTIARNDLMARDGTIYSSPIEFNTLYKEYGFSWRISNEESLFDYFEAGKFGTEAYTDLNYPVKITEISDFTPDEQANAELLCNLGGVTVDTPTLFKNCVIDVAATDGVDLFSDSYRSLYEPLSVLEVIPPPPSIVVTSFDPDTILSGNVPFSGIITGLSNIFNFNVSINGGEPIDFISAVEGDTFAFTLSSIELLEGDNQIVIFAEDNEGRTSTIVYDIVFDSGVASSKLPDTGQTTSFTDIFGEDADYNINPLSYTDNGNGTVTDNVTGLMWQQEDDRTTRNWTDAGNYCNNLTLAGHLDWRLPIDVELQSIIDYGVSNILINSTYFLNTTYRDSFISHSTYLSYSEMAWRVNSLGTITSDGKSVKEYVRCVRGEQTIGKSFTDNFDGSVTDNNTTLIWQQDNGGQKSWESAIQYCENLNLSGNSNWRLPNVKELKSIVDNLKILPAIDTSYFPNVYSYSSYSHYRDSFYWSSTTVEYYPDVLRWVVAFDGGFVFYDIFPDPTNTYYVRCVSGGQ